MPNVCVGGRLRLIASHSCWAQPWQPVSRHVGCQKDLIPPLSSQLQTGKPCEPWSICLLNPSNAEQWRPRQSLIGAKPSHGRAEKFPSPPRHIRFNPHTFDIWLFGAPSLYQLIVRGVAVVVSSAFVSFQIWSSADEPKQMERSDGRISSVIVDFAYFNVVVKMGFGRNGGVPFLLV